MTGALAGPTYNFRTGLSPARSAPAVPISGGFGEALTSIVADPNKFRRVFGDGRDDGLSEGGPGTDQNGGAASASSSTAAAGSPATSRKAGPNMGYGEALSAVGNVAGAFGGPMGLGIAGNLAGTGIDQMIANRELDRLGFETLDLGDFFSGVIANMTYGRLGTKTAKTFTNRFGFGLGEFADTMGMEASYGYAGFSPYGGQGFADPIGSGEDAYGGWGGYDAPGNIGPGADYESDADWASINDAFSGAGDSSVGNEGGSSPSGGTGGTGGSAATGNGGEDSQNSNDKTDKADKQDKADKDDNGDDDEE